MQPRHGARTPRRSAGAWPGPVSGRDSPVRQGLHAGGWPGGPARVRSPGLAIRWGVMNSVLFFFDFVSPYSWLALMGAPAFEKAHGVRFDLRPIVYAKVLEAHGLFGPVETPVKRRYTIHDVARCARRLGLRFFGPPEHPFRSLAALRVATLHRETP